MKFRKVWIVLITAGSLLFAACNGTNLPGTGQQSAGTASSTPKVIATAEATRAIVSTAISTQVDMATNPRRTNSVATVACQSPAPVTVALTEGPYWKANSPERSSLIEAGVPGTKITISGYVLDTNCQPVAGALLDFWQADAQGNYDNQGYVLRGHQFTGDDGRYLLETIVPGLYPGRTEHIHVKVQAPGGPVLTTQLFFPDQPQNQTDAIFDPSLVLPVQTVSGGLAAEYNFIVQSK